MFKLNKYSSQGSLNYYECTFKSITWKTCIDQEVMSKYIEQTQYSSEAELSQNQPSLTTFLFLNLFQQTDYLTGLDTFRMLRINLSKISVSNSELEIDSISGKTVINFDIQVTYT